MVDRRLQMVWVHRVLIRGLGAGSYAYHFVLALAEERGAPLDRTDLAKRIAPASEDPDGLMRKQKGLAKRAILEALTDAGRELGVDDPFPTGPTGCYRSALAPFVGG